MSNALKLPKGKTVKKPIRPSDHVSKRGVPYWWSPEWVRDLNGTICRIKPIKSKSKATPDDVVLYMLAKNGGLSYIQGSIQDEFQRWHQDNEIDYILLGVCMDEVLLTDWEYE